jgi:hypothetical protein
VVGYAEARADRVDRRPLGVADSRAALSVHARHLLRDREDKSPTAFNLVRRRLALEQLDRVARGLQAALRELLRRSIAGVVDLGPDGDDLVQRLALALLFARLSVASAGWCRFSTTPKSIDSISVPFRQRSLATISVVRRASSTP